MQRLCRGCLALFVLLSASGCWSEKELNDLAIVTGMGIDKVNNKFRVSIQVILPRQNTPNVSASAASITLFKAEGETILEALRKTTNTSPKRPFLSHLRVLFLGESLANRGIKDVFDFLSRNPRMRTDYYIAVAKGTSAEALLEVTTPMERISAINMFYGLQISERTGALSSTVTVNKLLPILASGDRSPVLPGIRIVGDGDIGKSVKNLDKTEPETRLNNAGLAVFKKDKLIGWLSENESIGYNYIINRVKSMVFHVGCPEGGNLSLEVIRSKGKITSSIQEGKPRIRISVRSEMNVSEVECTADISKPETIRGIEKLANEKVKGFMNGVIEKVREEYKVDIFGFGEAIHLQHPKYWKTVKKNWDELFLQVPVDIEVDMRIVQVGSTFNSFLKKEE